MSNIKKFLKFVCVGICNTAISLIIYYALKAIGVYYIIATVVGYIISSISGYFLSKIWVFNNKEEKKKSIFKYYILYGSALLLNVLLMAFQVSILGISDNIAPLFTLVVTTLYNFFFSKNVVFNPNFKISIDKIKEEISNNKLYYSLLLVLLILVSLMLFNNLYNQPAADDYTNLLKLNESVPDGEVSDVFEFVPAVIKTGINIYKHWQGSYFSNFLFYVHPLLISKNMYKFTSFIIQLFWLISIIFFFKSLVDKKEKNKKDIYLLGVLFTLLSILFMYSIAEGVYWLTGTILYIIPFAISLFFLGCLIKYFKTENNIWFITAGILALILGGTSYVTGLFVGFVLLCITVYFILKKDKRKNKFIILLLLYCGAFACNVFSPGNSSRINTDTNVSILGVIRITCVNTYEMVKRVIFKTVYIPFIVISFPAIKRIVAKSTIKFDKPFILSVLCFGCFASFFGPMALAYRTYYQETRVENIQFFYFIILSTVCIINYYGYLYQNKKLKKHSFDDSGYIALGILFSVFMMSSVGVENIEGVRMVEDILYSRSQLYNICQNYLDDTFIENKGKAVSVNACEVYPYSIHYNRYEKDSWITESIEEYYDIELIIEVE